MQLKTINIPYVVISDLKQIDKNRIELVLENQSVKKPLF